MLISTGTSKSWPGIRRARRGHRGAAAARTETREQVGEIHVVEGELCRRCRHAGAPSPAADGIPHPAAAAERVVGGALLRVLEGLVGLGDFLEARLGLRLLGDVRMIFLREPAIRLLDLVGGSAALDAERGVVVAVLHRTSVHCPGPMGICFCL